VKTTPVTTYVSSRGRKSTGGRRDAERIRAELRRIIDESVDIVAEEEGKEKKIFFFENVQISNRAIRRDEATESLEIGDGISAAERGTSDRVGNIAKDSEIEGVVGLGKLLDDGLALCEVEGRLRLVRRDIF